MANLSTAEAADILHVDPDTVKRYCQQGLIRAKKNRWGRWEIAEKVVHDRAERLSANPKKSANL